ncbi:MAG: DEAD/DEAH box helicase [Deltaproteobacteria bacterium]|nr:DEAD/DEAH box helicase [Deltaproteobacteria bacterium]
MRFDELKLHPLLLEAVQREGYAEPTPIQAQAIPVVLAGRDLLACAQTGTGKTAAFALPILQRLGSTPKNVRGPRALVLVPTRELATQVVESFATYSGRADFRFAVVFGGVSQHPQVRALRAGVDVLVAAPGRLLDLMQQRAVSLADVEVLVLDEADRMLDMGFIQPIRRIVQTLPKTRQNLMFSATMPSDIRTLAGSLLRDPAHVAVAPAATTIACVEQQVFHVDQAQKQDLLHHVLSQPAAARVLVFTRTKHGADRVVKRLGHARVEAAVIHGNKSQNARQRALEAFKDGRVQVLVATDVAARGIDVDGVSHVVNFDIPKDPESYVHRIGRTGRAGAGGVALSFCDRGERGSVRDIERLIRRELTVVGQHPFSNDARVTR